MRELGSILLAAFFMLQPPVNARAQEAQAPAASPAESSRAATIEQAVRSAALDSVLEVKLLTGRKLQGRLKSVNGEDFVLEPVSNESSVNWQIRFDQVRSLKVLNPAAAAQNGAGGNRATMSQRGKMILVAGFAALAVGVVIYATTKGP